MAENHGPRSSAAVIAPTVSTGLTDCTWLGLTEQFLNNESVGGESVGGKSVDKLHTESVLFTQLAELSTGLPPADCPGQTDGQTFS